MKPNNIHLRRVLLIGWFLACGVLVNFVVGALATLSANPNSRSVSLEIFEQGRWNYLQGSSTWPVWMPPGAPAPTLSISHRRVGASFNFLTHDPEGIGRGPNESAAGVKQSPGGLVYISANPIGKPEWSADISDFGWPMQSWREVRRTDESFVSLQRPGLVGRLERGLMVPPRLTDRRLIVPTLPIFPGFLINTIFYAIIAYTLSLVPGVLRRLRARPHKALLSEGGMLAR